MKVYLIVAKGKHQGTPILIKVDLFLMGSDKICQLRSLLPGIAPQHCALETRDKKVFVRNLGEGFTSVNGNLVPPGEEWPIHNGNRLVVGPLEFLVQFREKQHHQHDTEDWALRTLDQDSERVVREFAEEDSSPHGPRAPATAAQAAASILDKLQLQRGVVKGRMRISETEGVTLIRFDDTHLVEQAELNLIRRELVAAINRPRMRVLLDFKNVVRMSSHAAEMVVEVAGHVRKQSGSLALCRVRHELRDIFQTLGLFQSVRYFDDKKQALAGRW